MPADRLGALSSRRFDGRFDNFAVRLGRDGAGVAGATRARGTPDAVQVDFVRLRGFVVEDCGDVFDVETARGEVGGEEVGRFA